MEDVRGSLALSHSTRIMMMELYNDNDSDNCSPLAQPIVTEKGWHKGVAMKGNGIIVGDCCLSQDVSEAAHGIYCQRRDGTKGV